MQAAGGEGGHAAAAAAHVPAAQERWCGALRQHGPLRAHRLPPAARLPGDREAGRGLDQVAREGGGPLLGVSLSSSDVFCFAFLSISLLASVSLSLFFLFLRPCLIHARMPDWGRAFMHGHTLLHSWSGPMTLVVGLLHGATFLSNYPLVLFVSFIGT